MTKVIRPRPEPMTAMSRTEASAFVSRPLYPTPFLKNFFYMISSKLHVKAGC